MKMEPYSYMIRIPEDIPTYYPCGSGYGILYKDQPMFIERRDYTEDRWAVISMGSCLNKESMQFVYERIPSSRDEEFISNHRFTLEEAKKAVENLFAFWRTEGVNEIPKK